MALVTVNSVTLSSSCVEVDMGLLQSNAQFINSKLDRRRHCNNVLIQNYLYPEMLHTIRQKVTKRQTRKITHSHTV